MRGESLRPVLGFALATYETKRPFPKLVQHRELIKRYVALSSVTPIALTTVNTLVGDTHAYVDVVTATFMLSLANQVKRRDSGTHAELG